MIVDTGGRDREQVGDVVDRRETDDRNTKQGHDEEMTMVLRNARHRSLLS